MIWLVGSEGVIDVVSNNLTVKHSFLPEVPGFGGYDSLFTFSKRMQEDMQKEYNAKWSADQWKRPVKEDIVFKAPADYSDHLDHFTNFFDAIRTGKPVVEDATFGFRAAAPAWLVTLVFLAKNHALGPRYDETDAVVIRRGRERIC